MLNNIVKMLMLYMKFLKVSLLQSPPKRLVFEFQLPGCQTYNPVSVSDLINVLTNLESEW